VAEGCNFTVRAVNRHDGGDKIRAVIVRTLGFLIVSRLLGLVGLGPSPDARDVEIAVLRHQLAVLSRQLARPREGCKFTIVTVSRHDGDSKIRVVAVRTFGFLIVSRPAGLLGSASRCRPRRFARSCVGVLEPAARLGGGLSRGAVPSGPSRRHAGDRFLHRRRSALAAAELSVSSPGGRMADCPPAGVHHRLLTATFRVNPPRATLVGSSR
jgi:hypothetical protein